VSKIRYENLISYLHKVVNKYPDQRVGKNCKYKITDAALGAFSVFFTQSPSFLQHQKLLESRFGMSNANTLFGMKRIPSDNQIRNLLDKISPKKLNTVFTHCIKRLENSYLHRFKTSVGLLIALDGTWYFSSERISCKNCSKRSKNGITTNYHSMINPALVSPNMKQVIPLQPEFMTPQDGDIKQDCENKAAKRWLITHGAKYTKYKATILGDDLYSRETLIRQIKTQGFNFILVCKPKSHKTLYEWLKGIKETKTVTKWVNKKRQTWKYSFVSKVPLSNSPNSQEVNWLSLEITNDTGRRIYHNAFVTNHKVTEKTVEQLILYGRTRWKIENEVNNTLKTKGYNRKHNYGHGSHYLSSHLATMNILAFLFHTILEIVDDKYRNLLEMIGRRKEYFNHIRILFQYNCFTSWNRMLWYMIEGLKRPHKPEVSFSPI